MEIKEPEPQPEEVQNEPTKEDTTEPEPDTQEEPKQEESASETIEDETEEVEVKEVEEKEEPKEEPKKEESKKEVAAKKRLEKMGDNGRYDSANQLKTLIVMQVLGDTKSFFESQKQLEDRLDFFTDYMIPDAQIQNNNIAQWYLFGGSDGMMNDMIELQWQK